MQMITKHVRWRGWGFCDSSECLAGQALLADSPHSEGQEFPAEVSVPPCVLQEAGYLSTNSPAVGSGGCQSPPPPPALPESPQTELQVQGAAEGPRPRG